MKDVIFWGATGQARVLREALMTTEYRLVAIFDNRPLPSPFDDVPIFLGLDGLESWLSRRQHSIPVCACVAVGGNRGQERLNLLETLQNHHIDPLTVVHSHAFVAGNTQIGPGSQILAMSAVCTHVTLGRGVIINTAASVDHDCVIANGVHVGPGAHLAGEVQVGNCAFIGAGAIILPRLKIGHMAVIGAGAVVTRDIHPGATVIGNPAKPLVH